jgi:hypothetical protein
MISSYQSSGTLLYPLLGKGYHRSAYGFIEYPLITWRLVKRMSLRTFFSFSALFVALLYLVGLKNSSKNRTVLISAIFLSVLLGSLTINLLTLSIHFRYSFAFSYASLTTLIMYALCEKPNVRNLMLKRISYVAVLLSMGFFLRDYFFKSPAVIWEHIKSFDCSYELNFAGKSLSSEKERLAYSMAQRSIPQGQAVIARCFDPCLLDFKRNPVYIVDMLILGPKPGMPVFGGGEAVAKYLLSQKIRYVLYSYSDFGTQENKRLIERIRRGNLRDKQQCLFTLKFEQDLQELGKTRKKIYSDERLFVIDLNS